MVPPRQAAATRGVDFSAATLHVWISSEKLRADRRPCKLHTPIRTHRFRRVFFGDAERTLNGGITKARNRSGGFGCRQRSIPAHARGSHPRTIRLERLGAGTHGEADRVGSAACAAVVGASGSEPGDRTR